MGWHGWPKWWSDPWHWDIANGHLACLEFSVYVIVIDQFLRFVCSIEARIPRAKPEGWVFLYCIQSEGLVNNYFLAHCFLGYNKHVVSPQELYECFALTLRNCITVNKDENSRSIYASCGHAHHWLLWLGNNLKLCICVHTQLNSSYSQRNHTTPFVHRLTLDGEQTVLHCFVTWKFYNISYY